LKINAQKDKKCKNNPLLIYKFIGYDNFNEINF